jgi:hypothetical protein
LVVLESLRIALQSLRANPLRSLLTLVGIAVGIAAVLHVVSLGRVTQVSITKRLESMGTNVLLIRPGYSHLRGVRTAEGVTSLTWDDARELAATSQSVTTAVPTYSGPGNAEHRELKLPPTEYFKRNFFVAARGDEPTLPSVVDLVGDENVVFNTDYPHPDGTWPWGMESLGRQPISEESKRKILWDNALAFYRFPQSLMPELFEEATG